jgi:hypothetical protein
MVPTYNGWEDTPEDEREALELWEEASENVLALPRRSRASLIRISVELEHRS